MMSEVGKVSLGLEIDGSAEKQMDNLASRFTRSLKSAFKSRSQEMSQAFKNVASPKIDTEKARSQIGWLSESLENVNARIEAQQQKLAGLKESFGNTFNEARKNKINEQILATEARLLTLTKTSDTTSQKIWKLEDSLNGVAGATGRSKQPISQMDRRLKSLNTRMNESRKSASTMGRSFTSTFKRILRQVFVFAIIYKAIRGLNEYIGSSLKTNEQFMKSVNAIRTNLAVAFQPIYEAILPALQSLTDGLARATTYVAAFISALFGKTYKESFKAAQGLEAARKAMDKYGKSAKKTAGELASFDELNTLGNNQGVDAGFSMAIPDMDIDSIQTKVDELASGIKAALKDLVNENDILRATESLNRLKDTVKRLGGSFDELVSSPAAKAVGKIFVSWGIGKVTGNIELLNGALMMLEGGIQGVNGILSGDFEKTWNGAEKIVKGWYGTLEGFAYQLFPAAGDAVHNFGVRFGETWAGIKDDIKRYGDPAKLEAKDFAYYIRDKFAEAWDSIYTKTTTRWRDVRDTLKQRYAESGRDSDGFVLGVMRSFEGLIEFVGGVFTADWKKAWNGIKNLTGGIGDEIYSVFRFIANKIIDANNWMVRALNKFSIDVPDWVAKISGMEKGGKFGFNLKEANHVPALASGGVVRGPTLAMVGDNRGANVDPEVVSPLSTLQDMLTGSNQEIVEAIYALMQVFQSYTNRPVILEANGTQLAKVVDNSRDDRNRRAGRTLSMG